MRKTPISVYTDGSASYKAADGAWSFVAIKGDAVAELYCFEEGTTISVMELKAIEKALAWIPEGTAPIRIFSDSQYAVNSINIWSAEWKLNNWFVSKGKRPAHWQLIQEIDRLLEMHRKTRAVTLTWIRGHVYRWNEVADKLAGTARKQKLCNWTPPN